MGSHFNVFEINPIYYAFIIFSLMTTGSLAEILRSAILTVRPARSSASHWFDQSPSLYPHCFFPQALRFSPSKFV